jgi:hypothetical protein
VNDFALRQSSTHVLNVKWQAEGDSTGFGSALRPFACMRFDESGEKDEGGFALKIARSPEF